MQPQANLVGINNDALIFNNEGHLWPVSGNSNPKFIQANNFTSDFLFPLLPCNTITSTNNIKEDKKIIAIKNVLGESTIPKINTPLYYIILCSTVPSEKI